jgi:hypothetical protein
MLLEPRSRERFSTEQGKRGKFDAKQDSRRGRKPAAPGPLRRFGYLDKAREPGVGETLIMSAVLPSQARARRRRSGRCYSWRFRGVAVRFASACAVLRRRSKILPEKPLGEYDVEAD